MHTHSHTHTHTPTILLSLFLIRVGYVKRLYVYKGLFYSNE